MNYLHSQASMFKKATEVFTIAIVAHRGNEIVHIPGGITRAFGAINITITITVTVKSVLASSGWLISVISYKSGSDSLIWRFILCCS